MSGRTTLAIRNFTSSFSELLRLPRAFWFVIGTFALEVGAYYGVLTLMTTYLSTDLHWGDVRAGTMVSVFTMLVTLFMLGAASYAERFGVRRALLFALLLTFAGRALYSLAPRMGSGLMIAAFVVGSLVIVALGEAIAQPVSYSGIKQYTDAKTHSMGYGLIYAIMNLALVGVGAVSSWMRPAVQAIKDGKPLGHIFARPVLEFFASFSATGVQAANWAFVGLTGITLVLLFLLMTRRAEAAKLRPDPAEEIGKGPALPLRQRLKEFFAGGPLSNPRFVFFVFMLLPVRTLFAHQWLTMPQYILRAYSEQVAGYMEVLVFWVNAGIIFFGVPIATALTRHVNIYTMMIIGTLVSAAPTFLLSAGPSLPLLLGYLVVFSVGEALWSARFLEYASELAPPGRVAQYMGMANIPWLLAKGTTGLYSGFLLSHFCPANTPRNELHTGRLWFIYGCIAMLSPIGLWLGRRWVRAERGKP